MINKSRFCLLRQVLGGLERPNEIISFDITWFSNSSISITIGLTFFHLSLRRKFFNFSMIVRLEDYQSKWQSLNPESLTFPEEALVLKSGSIFFLPTLAYATFLKPHADADALIFTLDSTLWQSALTRDFQKKFSTNSSTFLKNPECCLIAILPVYKRWARKILKFQTCFAKSNFLDLKYR